MTSVAPGGGGATTRAGQLTGLWGWDGVDGYRRRRARRVVSGARESQQRDASTPCLPFPALRNVVPERGERKGETHLSRGNLAKPCSQAIGRVLGLAEALLGGTIMCWAASAGDVAAAMAISRSGEARRVTDVSDN